MPPNDQEALILQMAYDLDRLRKQSEQAIGIVDTSSGKMVARSKVAMAEIEKSFGTVTASKFQDMLAGTAKLQDKLAAAQAAGNGAETKALREQIALQGALQKAAVAQLETQLAIARATGNKAQVAQLGEALALQSQLSKFQSIGLTGSRALHEAEAAVVALSVAERAAEGANVGKALDKVFDSSKLAIMEEGAAKIRVFGSALEPLGPIGIGVAAAIGAVAIAAEEARKAMEWADDLDRTAKKLGTTTTSLQELDYASVATSIGLQQGRDALSQFNEKIGAFESHVRDKTMVKFADGIRLTRQEVQQTVDPIEKLRLVMEKLSKLPDAQQRTAAAKAFGLDGLLPLINEGSEGIDKFIGKMREARENGSIVSPEQIARAAELNDKVEEFTYRIGVDFKKIFIELAPVVERVAEFIERCTSALSGFLGEIPAAISGVQDLIDKLPHIPTGVHVSQDLKDAAKQASIDVIPGGRQAHDIISAGRQIFDGLVQRGRDRENRFNDVDDPDAIRAEFLRSQNNRQRPGETLVTDKPPHTGSKHDETLSFDKAANDAYAAGLKALIDAQLALTADINERAVAEKAAIDAELAKKTNDKGTGDLDIEEKKIRAAKIDAHKAEQLALIEKAKTEERNAAAAKKELIDRQTQFALEDQADETRKQIADTTIAQLQAAAAQATTAEERTRIERDILKLKQDEYIHELGKKLSRQVETGEISQDVADQRNQAGLDTQAAERTQFDTAHKNPIQRFEDSVQDFATTAQEAGVSAMKNLSTGLADAIVNAHSLGDVAKNVFRQLIADLLAAAIQKDIAAPLLHLIPGFAGGTDYAPGGLAIVGERGPELVNLPRGSQVTPSLPTVNALKNLSIPQGGGGLTVIQPFHFHAEGAVLTSELLAQANQQAAAYAQKAYAGSLRDGRKGLPDALRAHQLLRG